MTMNTSTTTYNAGRVPRADRIQRFVIGGTLMLLTVSGFLSQIDWRGIVALALQADLLLTGIVGWCPVYWSCRVGSKKKL